MLELGNDLFQTVVLGLLLVSLLLLLLAVNNLSKIKKTLEEGLTRSQIGDLTSAQGSDTSHSHGAPAAIQTATATDLAPEPAAWSGTPAATETSSSNWGEGSWSGPSETTPTPAPEAQQVPVQQQASAASVGPNPADMPDEQPVEHEGRWWFKRGGEILLYDEATGQWGPTSQAAAPQAAAPLAATQPVAGASAYSDFKDLASATPEPEPATGGSFGGEGSGFWKCESCGAVNGSTATSCRMCFAARV